MEFGAPILQAMFGEQNPARGNREDTRIAVGDHRMVYTVILGSGA